MYKLIVFPDNYNPGELDDFLNSLDPEHRLTHLINLLNECQITEHKTSPIPPTGKTYSIIKNGVTI